MTTTVLPASTSRWRTARRWRVSSNERPVVGSSRMYSVRPVERFDSSVDSLTRCASPPDTVVVIEHHLDVVKNADHVIDLGPLGGDRGGEIVATGTPEQIVLVRESFTGEYLRKILPPERVAAAKRASKRNGAASNGAKAAASTNGRGRTAARAAR